MCRRCYCNFSQVLVVSISNEILKICIKLALKMKLYSRRRKLREGEPAICNGSYLQWTVKHLGSYSDNSNIDNIYGWYLQWTVKHLGSYSDNLNIDNIYCNVGRSLFNDYVNKLKDNFCNLQSIILMNLFKSYCCSFMGILYKCIMIIVGKRGMLLYVTCCIYRVISHP